VAAEPAESLGDMGGLDAGDIGADDHNGTRRHALHDALHAAAEVAASLPDAGNAARPAAARRTCIRGNRQDRVPAPVVRHALQQGCGCLSGEAGRGSHTDLARQPRLGAARHRHLRHHDQPAAKRRRTFARRPLSCSPEAQSTGFQKAGTRR
jgi:hypothetical protein